MTATHKTFDFNPPLHYFGEKNDVVVVYSRSFSRSHFQNLKNPFLLWNYIITIWSEYLDIVLWWTLSQWIWESVKKWFLEKKKQQQFRHFHSSFLPFERNFSFNIKILPWNFHMIKYSIQIFLVYHYFSWTLKQFRRTNFDIHIKLYEQSFQLIVGRFQL